MGKKRFSEGLDDLFNNSQAEEQSGHAAVVPETPHERKHAHKNFASGLDSLLQEALEESLEKFEANQPDSVTQSGKSKAGKSDVFRSPLRSGLDALIRQTIDVQEIVSDEQSGKKRLTVAVDRSKLEKLKVIARLENSYLKDLLVSLIDGYIEEYSQQKGFEL
jgi:hypothetical protein